MRLSASVLYSFAAHLFAAPRAVRSFRKADRRHRQTGPRSLVAEVLEERTLLSAVAPPDGIVSWWTGDGTPDDQEGLNNATLMNGATFAPGEVGQAFQFDGVDDVAQVTDSDSLKLTGSMTIEAWVRVDAYPQSVVGHGEIFFRGDDRTGLDPYSLSIEPDGSVQFQIQSLTAVAQVRAAIPLGQFMHVAATLDDASGVMRLYINGELQAQTETTVRPFGDLDPASNPGVGIGNNGGFPGTTQNRPFDGLIDELTIYNRALSPDEVQRIYAAGSDGKIKSTNYFASDFPTATEGPGSVVIFTITRAGDLSGEAIVNWSTADGTAKAGTDYVLASGQLVFADGESQKTVEITLIDDSTPEPSRTFGLVLSTPTPGYEAADGQATILDDDQPDPPAFSREADIAGYYFTGNSTTGGQPATVMRAGGNLTLINRFGGISFGYVIDGTQIYATFWNQAGVFDPEAGTITWANGTVWTKARTLTGVWRNSNGLQPTITQLGNDLNFTNAAGQTVTGRFLNATTIVAPGWNVTGTLANEGQRIFWSNGFVWNLLEDLTEPMANSGGNPVQVEQSGSELIFINRVGGTSAGHFVFFDQVVASDWGNMIGTLRGNSIFWSNGTVWTTAPKSSDPQIGGLYDDGGANSRVLQAGSQITLVDGAGHFFGLSRAHFTSATTLVADDWGVTATLAGNVLTFSNGDVWTLLPDLDGPHIDQTGNLTRVRQLERSLTFTDANGNVSTGFVIGATQFAGPFGGGTIADDLMTFANMRDVWLKLPDLRGNWESLNSTPTLRPLYMDQLGLSVLFVIVNGRAMTGTFTFTPATGLRIAATISGAATIGTFLIPGRQISFDNGFALQRPPASYFDQFFADPTELPFV